MTRLPRGAARRPARPRVRRPRPGPGAPRARRSTAATVITASPTPISAWTPSIAGSTVPSGTVPETRELDRRGRRAGHHREPRRHAARRPRNARARRGGSTARAERAARAPAPSAPMHAHVEDVRPERRDAAVGEQERLHDEHHRQHQAGEPRPEQDRRQRRAEEVPARAARHREVEHLRGEDERGGHAQQRDLALVERPVGPAQRRSRPRRPRRRPVGRRDLGGQEAVRDVHAAPLLSAVRRGPARTRGKPADREVREARLVPEALADQRRARRRAPPAPPRAARRTRRTAGTRARPALART